MSTETANSAGNGPLQQESWIKHSTFRFFKTMDQSLCIPITLALSQDIPTKVLKTQWEQISRDSYFVSMTARRALAEEVSVKIFKEEEILKAEKDIFEALDRAHGYFDVRIKQAELQLKEAGMTNLGLRGGAAKLYEAMSTSRTATRWLDLLRKADSYLVLNHQLWVVGEIGPDTQTEAEATAAKLGNEKGARDVLMELARTVNKRYLGIRDLVQKVRDQRKADEEVRRKTQSERDRAKHLAAIQGAGNSEASSKAGDAAEEGERVLEAKAA